MAYTTIDDPSAYFHTQLFTGNGSTQSITNDANAGDFKPDWLWIKSRGTTHGHALFDSNRGGNARLASEGNQEERTNEGNVTFQTDGFNVTSSHPTTNNNSTNMVAWQWKANGGTVANDTNGDITTSVQASQTAGFSIATYTGNGGSGQTLGHGLGAEADLIIFKDRESTSAWRTYVRLLGASKFLNLNTNDAAGASTNIFPSHSSTTIGVEQNDVMNKNNSDFVMYSFRSIQGYSKIGSFTGTGNANGPFVYTGFKPAWVMIKATASTGGASAWRIADNKRSSSGSNPVEKQLEANTNNAEDSGNDVDLLSNGFKVRSTAAQWNASGVSIIYMAFAESPFVSSKGVPTTAR